jgi:hypothetical protein
MFGVLKDESMYFVAFKSKMQHRGLGLSATTEGYFEFGTSRNSKRQEIGLLVKERS